MVSGEICGLRKSFSWKKGKCIHGSWMRKIVFVMADISFEGDLKIQKKLAYHFIECDVGVDYACICYGSVWRWSQWPLILVCDFCLFYLLFVLYITILCLRFLIVQF